MKPSLSLLVAGLVAVQAQLESLPQCGQTCVNNMLEIAVSDFGCDANDLASCACCNADFGFGIRDCSRQVCGDGSSDYSSVISYGSSYCASAVTTCPSGTQATTVLATATGSGSGGSGSGSASMPAMTSGPLAGAVGSINSISGSSDAYAVGSTTITAGGDAYDNDGTAYSALPSGGGVLVSNSDAQTTYVPGSGAGSSNSSSMSMTSGGGSGGALGAAASSVSTVQGSQGVYAIGDNTISAGGDNYANDGTTYSALPSSSGVLVAAGGSSTTYNPASGAGMATGGSTMSSSTSGGSGGGAGGAAQSSGGGSGGNSGGEQSSSGGSGNGAPIQTAAPALIGAAAMAILAL